MTGTGLASMRLAATLVHAVPGVRLRIRVGAAPPLEVARPPLGHPGAVSPCEFRDAVARAHAAEEEGMGDEGTAGEHDCDLAIEVVVPSGGCAHPSGIVRVGIDRLEVHAFATTLTPTDCCRLFAARREAERVVHLHRDEGTEVTLVHVEASPRERATVLDLMQDLLAGCVAGELIGA